MHLSRFASSLVVVAGILSGSAALAAEPEDTLILELEDGEVVIGLRPDLAPKHVEQIKTLVKNGEYDNVAFHRVIEGFMAQTGDVQYGDMADGYNSQLAGTVGMARAQDPDSANSQFFIMFAPSPSLNGSYTVVGEVESGMEHVDAIKRGDPAQNGVVTDPDRIVSARMAAE